MMIKIVTFFSQQLMRLRQSVVLLVLVIVFIANTNAQQDFLMLSYEDIEKAIELDIKEIKAVKYLYHNDTLDEEGRVIFILTNEPENLWIIVYFNQSENIWEDIYDIDRITYNYYEGQLDMGTIDDKQGGLKELHFQYEGDELSSAQILFNGSLKYLHHYAYDIHGKLRWIKITEPKTPQAKYKIEFIYDDLDNMVVAKFYKAVQEELILHEETQYTFDETGMLINSVKLKEGENTKFDYEHNEKGYKIKESVSDGADKPLYVISYSYKFFK